MNVIKSICLGLALLVATGCQRNEPIGPGQPAKSDTAAKGKETSDEPTEQDQGRMFLIAADKTVVSCGETVGIQEILVDPTDEVYPGFYYHNIYRASIPAKREVIANLEAFFKLAKKGATEADFWKTQRPGGCESALGERCTTGWEGAGGSSACIASRLAPNVLGRVSAVQFNEPGTFVLQSDWIFDENGKERKLRAYLLVTVKKNTAQEEAKGKRKG
jgi:hypothetical protein